MNNKQLAYGLKETLKILVETAEEGNSDLITMSSGLLYQMKATVKLAEAELSSKGWHDVSEFYEDEGNDK